MALMRFADSEIERDTTKRRQEESHVADAWIKDDALVRKLALETVAKMTSFQALPDKDCLSYTAFVRRMRPAEGPAKALTFHRDPFAPFTVNVLLNNGFQGGDLIVVDPTQPSLLRIDREPGEALTHTQAVPHGVCPVEQGARYSLIIHILDERRLPRSQQVSDAHALCDVVRIGRTPAGLPLSSFAYKSPKTHGEGRFIGCVAQDLLEATGHHEAVAVDPLGRYIVDYSKIDCEYGPVLDVAA